jgi:hypothetical protein
VAAVFCLVDALTLLFVRDMSKEATAHAEWHMRASQNEPSVTISSSVTWHVDCYARGREATAPAGNEARK